ncbi:hypothetical protein GCM10009682_01880 [Luedemannella flava]|uniref:glutamate--cysteine ligase n=1 Tax=Luedemannella flava TaxID=349316 RepID=A0ABP4XKW5_9ACTN
MVDWALQLPMIYRVHAGRTTTVPPVAFSQILLNGFDDGSRPDLFDWECHLSQVWPHVRVRKTLETRAFDALPWPMFSAAPAFWAGLAYDDRSLAEALELLSCVTVEHLRDLTSEVPIKGLGATCGGRSVLHLSAELLRLAHRGLLRRVEQNIEPSWVPDLLDPLLDVVTSGVTFAERSLREWGESVSSSPLSFVDAVTIGGARRR